MLFVLVGVRFELLFELIGIVIVVALHPPQVALEVEAGAPLTLATAAGGGNFSRHIALSAIQGIARIGEGVVVDGFLQL